MSAPPSIASVLSDVINYVIAYATGNDGCIQSMTAVFQPSGQIVTGYKVSNSVNQVAGFLFERNSVPQGVQVNIIFYSTTMPSDTLQISLSFTTSNNNTYQLAVINTFPTNNNYALVVIVNLTFTVQPTEYVNVSNLLNVITSFASDQCQTLYPAQVTYQGNGFSELFSYTNLSNGLFNAVFLATNTTQNTSLITINMLLNNTVVATSTIYVPPNEYAYFMFSLTAELEVG